MKSDVILGRTPFSEYLRSECSDCPETDSCALFGVLTSVKEVEKDMPEFRFDEADSAGQALGMMMSHIAGRFGGPQPLIAIGGDAYVQALILGLFFGYRIGVGVGMIEQRQCWADEQADYLLQSLYDDDE